MEEIRALREELARFDETEFARLRVRSFTGIPVMNYAFFPGGNGLFHGIEVKEFPKIRILVLGSDFACSTKHVDEWNRLLNTRSDERDGPTWTPMLDEFGQTPIIPDECFFTNAWPFLHLPLEGGRESSDNPPIDLWRGDEDFMRRCVAYFRFTLRVVKPTLVVALGKGPALFLGEVWPRELTKWKFPADRKLERIQWSDLDRLWVETIPFEGRSLRCVAVNHPSKSRLNAKHRTAPYKDLDGEIRLLIDAAQSVGIV